MKYFAYVLPDAAYDILITDANGKTVLDKQNVLMAETNGVHKVTFDSAGNVHVKVIFLGSKSTQPGEKIIE